MHDRNRIVHTLPRSRTAPSIDWSTLCIALPCFREPAPSAPVRGDQTRMFAVNHLQKSRTCGGDVDNGSAFVDSALLRACARLGIKLIHSTPGRPQGRGKIERFFRTVREQFLVEVDTEKVTDLAMLNRLFTAWVEQVYHRRAHSETGQQPLERWLAGAPFPTPTPDALREAFRWSELRKVAKTATVSLQSIL